MNVTRKCWSVSYLVKQQNEVDCKGHKQSQHSHVVEISCKVVLREKRERHSVRAHVCSERSLLRRSPELSPAACVGKRWSSSRRLTPADQAHSAVWPSASLLPLSSSVPSLRFPLLERDESELSMQVFSTLSLDTVPPSDLLCFLRHGFGLVRSFTAVCWGWRALRLTEPAEKELKTSQIHAVIGIKRTFYVPTSLSPVSNVLSSFCHI